VFFRATTAVHSLTFVSAGSDVSAACSLPSPLPITLSVPAVYSIAEDEPDELTISFLFDYVFDSEVQERAKSNPAYSRLAALQERVIARLNAPPS